MHGTLRINNVPQYTILIVYFTVDLFLDYSEQWLVYLGAIVSTTRYLNQRATLRTLKTKHGHYEKGIFFHDASLIGSKKRQCSQNENP